MDEKNVRHQTKMKVYQIDINHIPGIELYSSLEGAKRAVAEVYGIKPEVGWKEHCFDNVKPIRHWTYGEFEIWEREVIYNDDGLGMNVIEGLMLFDQDSANVTLKFRGMTRLLVVPEWRELMKPTKPCVQLSFQNIFAEILKGEEKDS